MLELKMKKLSMLLNHLLVNFKGLVLSPPQRITNYDLKSMKEFSRQATTIVEQNPSSGRSKKIFEEMMKCGIK